jgi:hypothetical protein
MADNGITEICDPKPQKPTSKTTNSSNSAVNEQAKNKSVENIALKNSSTERNIDNKNFSSKKSADRKSSSKNNYPAISSLFDFIVFIYNYKSAFNHNELSEKLSNFVTNEGLTDNQITELSNIVKDKDLELKKSRFISELIIRKSCYKKDGYETVLNFLERIVNQYLNFEQTDNFMLSKVAQENNGEIPNILVDKIDKSIKRQQKKSNEIKSSHEDNKENKVVYKILHDNLIIIGFSWLYYFKYMDSNMFFGYSLKSVFELKNGETENLISANSLGFTSSMVTSTNKKDFSFLLSYFYKYNSRFQAEITEKNKSINLLENENKRFITDVENQKKLISESKSKISELENEISHLKSELAHNEDVAKHEEIHLKDVNNKNQSMFLRFLEDDIFEMLLNANKSLQSSPPNTEFTQSYLEMVIERVEDKIKCLK